MLDGAADAVEPVTVTVVIPDFEIEEEVLVEATLLDGVADGVDPVTVVVVTPDCETDDEELVEAILLDETGVEDATELLLEAIADDSLLEAEAEVELEDEAGR